MNTIRTIEGTTLVAIGAFCATVLINFAVHGTHASAAGANKFDSNSTIATVQLAPIVIHGKRLTPAQKATIANEHAVG
jgi:uncharacterized membrane protein YphA (DoxX/SURF4 family)